MASDTKARFEIPSSVTFPVAAADLLRRRRALKKELSERPNLTPVRIAILGGSTTTEVRSTLEVFLLAEGVAPTFYESGYDRYCEDVLFQNPELWEFKPDIVFIHTTWSNVSRFPELLADDLEVEQQIQSEMGRFESVWGKIHAELGALIIQNNFDLPPIRPLGNLEASQSFARVNFLLRLNAAFAEYARSHSRFLVNDILYLSAQVGLSHWYSETYWYRFHMAVSPIATVALAQNVAAIIKASYGKSKKCLVLDLDNTLWGGVIGDDGVQNIVLGRDHPVGEAYLDFQRYVKDLKARGVILAVCSKNDPDNAIQGFSHPDSILKVEDFSAFKANWNPKPENVQEIAAELNIGLDSLVFVDDNPVERELVARELPEVAVPDIGSDVSGFAKVIDQARFFETDKIVQDDLSRSGYYRANVQRNILEAKHGDYSDFLDSLTMSAEIGRFVPIYLERITQLINKTNQFNLTTRRYTIAEIEKISRDPDYMALYGRLADRFGDNGLVSVVIGRLAGVALEIDLWVMSCRVFKREMELAMFDALVEECQARGIQRITGVYIPSKKNGLVSGHYASLGFHHVSGNHGERESWSFEVSEGYSNKACHIDRTAGAIFANA